MCSLPINLNTFKQTVFSKPLLFVTLTAITILAFLPDYDALPPIISFSDLLNHTIAFTVLYILARQAYPTLRITYTVIALTAYAFFIEVVQYYLPTRFASWSDIGADVTGLFIGYICMLVFRRLPYTKNLFS